MTKRYEYYLDDYQVSVLFSPIRIKQDVINILIRTIKVMVINSDPDLTQISGKIILYISKMSRLFYVTDGKYFTINFPFTVLEEDGEILFKSKYGDDIDNKLTSDILSFVNTSTTLMSCDIGDFFDSLVEMDCNYENFWTLVRDLMIWEDGYLRYDYDTSNSNGRVHPINHIDIFYTDNNKIKLGLNNNIGELHMIDLVDVLTECHYLDTV